jgi:hypothetical protein
MSLINNPIVPTLTELDKIRGLNTMCLQVMKSTAKEVFALVWENPTASPQDICDMMGAGASGAFDLFEALQQLIYALDPTWVALVPPVEYTKNEDGTVTVGGDN